MRTTPITVTNFLNYITQGRYVNNMVHRTVNNFVIQGGGFNVAPLPTLFNSVQTNPAITNEPGNSNVRGTIAILSRLQRRLVRSAVAGADE